VRTHPVDKLLEQHCYKSASSDLTQVNFLFYRIETILDSDRVLVMDKGQIAEFGSPDELRRNKESLFSTLVNES
jgi:ABC-type transport system involved in Fe-S cluster assembly fused permease/ATPase subunit